MSRFRSVPMSPSSALFPVFIQLAVVMIGQLASLSNGDAGEFRVHPHLGFRVAIIEHPRAWVRNPDAPSRRLVIRRRADRLASLAGIDQWIRLLGTAAPVRRIVFAAVIKPAKPLVVMG